MNTAKDRPAEPVLWRLFIAAHPAPAFLDALAPVDRWLRRAGTHRLIPTDQRHVTFAFLGDAPRDRVGPLRRALDETCAGLSPITLTPGRVVALPAPSSPRVVALSLEGAGFAEARTAVLTAVSKVTPTDAVTRDLERAARAHITLARRRRVAAARRLDLASAPTPAGVPPLTIRRLRLVRSTLTPAGPEHHAIFEMSLAGPGPPEPTPNTPGDTH